MDIHELLGKLGGGKEKPRAGAVESSGTTKEERDAAKFARAQLRYEEERKALEEAGNDSRGNEKWIRLMRKMGRK